MAPVGKALWYIERHFGRERSLDEIASIGGVSRYHMTRAFGAATGHSIMRYVRGRRMTEAARALAAGAPDIPGPPAGRFGRKPVGHDSDHLLTHDLNSVERRPYTTHLT